MRGYNQRQMTRPLHPIANPIYRVIPNARANVREGPYDALGSAVACVGFRMPVAAGFVLNTATVAKVRRTVPLTRKRAYSE